MYVKNFKTVPYDFLWERGINLLVFDIDNTLAVFTEKVPSSEIISFFEDLKSKGFSVALLSNNSKERVEGFNKNLGLFAIAKAGKPKRGGIKKILKHFNVEPYETAIIGDQIFTDIWCGNRMGVYTVLTRPLAKIDEFTVKLKRFPEKAVLKIIEKKYKK
ncbi:MAG: YqeG family HAD IIIA-type phosphatase [Defluviitaleaceae bacterium]|nr:YqeG family HAD IIIA-type phosphatase [Defluviitaleaceae bacterium]